MINSETEDIVKRVKEITGTPRHHTQHSLSIGILCDVVDHCNPAVLSVMINSWLRAVQHAVWLQAYRTGGPCLTNQNVYTLAFDSALRLKHSGRAQPAVLHFPA